MITATEADIGRKVSWIVNEELPPLTGTIEAISISGQNVLVRGDDLAGLYGIWRWQDINFVEESRS